MLEHRQERDLSKFPTQWIKYFIHVATNSEGDGDPSTTCTSLCL